MLAAMGMIYLRGTNEHSISKPDDTTLSRIAASQPRCANHGHESNTPSTKQPPQARRPLAHEKRRHAIATDVKPMTQLTHAIARPSATRTVHSPCGISRVSIQGETIM